MSARSSVPVGDSDFDAIEALLGASERGRAFLALHAARSRRAEVDTLLAALARSERQPPPAVAWFADLRERLRMLRESIGEALGRTDAEHPWIVHRAETSLGVGPVENALTTLNEVRVELETTSWTMREHGADARVCNLFATQASRLAHALAALRGHVDAHHAAIYRALDEINRIVAAGEETDARAVSSAHDD